MSNGIECAGNQVFFTDFFGQEANPQTPLRTRAGRTQSGQDTGSTPRRVANSASGRQVRSAGDAEQHRVRTRSGRKVKRKSFPGYE